MWDKDKLNMMISIVQVYVHITKDIQISIQLRNGGDILLLKKAYEIAAAWLQWSNIKINKI